MSYEYIVNPQVFLSPITAVMGFQEGLEKYPYITGFETWENTVVSNTTSIDVPGTFIMADEPEAYIVSIGGVIQSPLTYTPNINGRTINFNSILSAGLNYHVRQLATSIPSSQNFFTRAANIAFLTAGDIVATTLTVLSTISQTTQTVNVITTAANLTATSIFVSTNVNVSGSIIAGSNITASSFSGTLNANDITTGSLPAFRIANGQVSNTEFEALSGVTADIQDQINSKVASNTAITGATKTKITYDSKGLVTNGADLVATDLPSHVIATNSGLGSQHTISGATAGHVFRATGATTAAIAAIQATDLPTGIDAVKIGNGSVSNAEFQALSGVTTDIQAQINLATRKYATNIGNGSLTAFTVTHNLNTRDVQTTVYDNTNYDSIITSIKNLTTNTVGLSFDSAPSTNAYRVVVIG